MIKSAVWNNTVVEVRRWKTSKRFWFYRKHLWFLRGELRASRSLQAARGTSRFALVASRAGNFALRARCKLRIARNRSVLISSWRGCLQKTCIRGISIKIAWLRYASFCKLDYWTCVRPLETWSEAPRREKRTSLKTFRKLIRSPRKRIRRISSLQNEPKGSIFLQNFL